MALSSSIYISFPGNAAEAFPYYADLFGGDLDVATYDAMPAMGDSLSPLHPGP